MSDPNVLLIVMDAVRASNTSLYGYKNRTTPYLEEFHDNHGTLFRNTWAPSTWSLPSHTSMFTGTHAESHGIDSPNKKLETDKSIFYELSNSGYRTGLFSHNVWLTKVDVGLKDGFDKIVDSNYLPYPSALSPLFFDNKEFNGKYRKYIDYMKESFANGKTIKSVVNGLYSKTSSNYPRINSILFNEDRSGFIYQEEFKEWVKNSDDKWATCINLMDAHAPYRPKDKYDLWSDQEAKDIQEKVDDLWMFHTDELKWWRLKALESLYDGSIRQVDQVVSKIIKSLKAVDEFDNTYIVITADHGEGFGEYNKVSNLRSVGHKPNITESLLRVPLLLKNPYQTDSFTVDELSSLAGYADSVKSVRREEDAKRSFCDEPIIASYSGMMESNRKGALEYLEDIDDLDKTGRVVYKKDESQNIIKYMKWGDQVGKRIIGSEESSGDQSVNDIIEEYFSCTSNSDLDSGDGSSSIDDSVEDRLRRLGYR